MDCTVYKHGFFYFRLATAKFGIGAKKVGLGLLTGNKHLQQKGAGLILKGAAVGAASHFLPSNNGRTTNTFRNGQRFRG